MLICFMMAVNYCQKLQSGTLMVFVKNENDGFYNDYILPKGILLKETLFTN